MQISDLQKIEESILGDWNNSKMREKVNALNKGNKIFFFLEGPPYVNGELHLGHIRGYARKDAILRYKRMCGYDVFDRAGFDVHGLPIENKVEKNLGLTSKRDIESKIGVKAFIAQCTDAYKSYLSKQISDALRYGVWFDFENAYIAANPEYIDKSFQVFKKIYDKGLVYKGINVMPYCIHCGTVLAKGPEIEEEEDNDPSIYFTFKINTKLSKPKIIIDDNTYLLIWTTTPWTIPANMSVAANPDALYVKVKIEGKTMILAKDRLEAVSKEFSLSPIIIGEFKGLELEGLYYTNPMEDNLPKQKESRKYHKILFSNELVSMSDGTGLVQIAPAYGPEDFVIAKNNKVPMLSIVDNDGKYNSDAGKYAGMQLIHDANREIEKELKAFGSLLGKGNILHSYPHCWRCHNKLVYLPTEQWFINVAKLKKKIIKQCDKVAWYPPKLKDWFIETIESAPDWVVSRQRYWDIPLPIWVCDKCKDIQVIGSFSELKSKNQNIKYTSEDLHRPVIDSIEFKCSKCDGVMHRVSDVFDVWYDSGVAHTASLSEAEFNSMFPNAFVTEGPDQLRGWFATLMKTGVAAYGKSPFKTILMQGWVVDSKGEAMHKSKGNYVSANELIGKYALDAVRAFTLLHVSHESLKFNTIEIKDMEAMLLLLHNVDNLMNEYSSLFKYDLKNIKKPKNSKDDIYNSWIMSRLNQTIKDVTYAFDKYEIDYGMAKLLKFVIEDFSRFYLKIAKKQLSDSSKAKAHIALNNINYIMYNIVLLLGPICPFNTEYLYKKLYNKKESLFMEHWPKYKEDNIDNVLESEFEMASSAISAILSNREALNVPLRQPIASATIELTDDEAYKAISKLSSTIEEFTNSKKIEILRGYSAKREIKPAFAKLGPDFKNNAAMVAAELKLQDADVLDNAIKKDGHYVIHITGKAFDIKPEHFSIIEVVEGGNSTLFKYGKAHIDSNITPELKDELIIREFERSIQLIRKELNLKKSDVISLSYHAPPSMLLLLNKNKHNLSKNLNAQIKDYAKSDETRNIKIDEMDVEINVEHI